MLEHGLDSGKSKRFSGRAGLKDGRQSTAGARSALRDRAAGTGHEAGISGVASVAFQTDTLPDAAL